MILFRQRWLENTPINTILAEFGFSFSRLHGLVRLMGLEPKRDHAHWVPSPEEIAAAAAEIREGWSDEERALRASRITDPLPESFLRNGRRT
jgi:hypothetical protein